ncbi:MAG: hypothetical protein ABGW98_00475, partial [Myxococcales bacterium]
MDWARAHDEHDPQRYDALSSFMLLAMVSHCGMLIGRDVELGRMAATVLLPAYVLSAVVGLSARSMRPYCLALSLAMTTWWLVLAWPHFANHLFLEWSVLLFLVLSQRDPELGMKAARWMIVIVLFHSGLQKMVMGQYFNGAFLAFNTATIQNFSDFMGLVLSGDEFARIREMAGKPGTGPYAVSDPLFVVMSNLVWIGEMSLGPLLLFKKTRKFAVAAAIALIVSIELGARELIFGCLFG